MKELLKAFDELGERYGHAQAKQARINLIMALSKDVSINTNCHFATNKASISVHASELDICTYNDFTGGAARITGIPR